MGFDAIQLVPPPVLESWTPPAFEVHLARVNGSVKATGENGTLGVRQGFPTIAAAPGGARPCPGRARWVARFGV